MKPFLKTVVIFLLLAQIAALNGQTTTPEQANIFAAQSSPQPNIGVNGRGIFTGTPLASRRGPRVTLHSYPWLTYNKLIHSENNTGKTLVYTDDTSFALPSKTLGSPIPSIPTIPSIPRIPSPPKLPKLPEFPATVRSSRKVRSVITPQIIQAQAQTFPNFQLGTAFPPNFNPQFPSFPFPYPIPYTIITQVIPILPVIAMASGEGSGAAEIKPVAKPETETTGEFSGAVEIEGPYPEPVTPEAVAEGEFVGAAEIQGPYPEPVKPEVAGEAIGEAMLAPYPAVIPETEIDAVMLGPYPAPVTPIVSGEASGSATIEGPYPAVLPETKGEAIATGPYPAPVAPVVSGEASGSAVIEGPYPATVKPEVSSEAKGPYPVTKPVASGEGSGSGSVVSSIKFTANTKKTYKLRRPNPVPVKSVLTGAQPIVQIPPPVSVKPLEENPSGLKEFLLELEQPASVVSEGVKNKGPYLIPKMSETGVDLGALTKPVVPTASRGGRVSYAARLKEVVYPEYLRDASGRIVRLN